MEISGAEGIRLSNPANRVTEIVHRDSTFVDLTKTTVIFAVALEKEYNKKSDAISTVDIVQDTMGYDFLTEVSARPYRQYIRFSKITLRHKCVLSLVGSLNGANAGLGRLRIFDFDNIGLYTATKKELCILIRVASNFVKNSNNPALFHAPIY